MKDEDRDTGTVLEAARYLKISRNAAYQACERGEIPCLRIGGRIVVSMKRLREKVDGAAA
jgi:excisionase family DNA binding protein